MEIKLSNGKDHVYQWDADITISVPEDVTEVHFRYWPTNKPVAVKDGKVEIPPELMWTTDTIRLWTYKPDHTLDEAKIEVHARPRPDGYAYTPTEIKTWGQLEKRIETLEQDGVKGSVTSVNGKQGDVELDAEDVGAVASVNGAEGVVQTAWYATVTQSGDTVTIDHTPQEIYDAYAAGYSVYARATYTAMEDVPLLLPLVLAVNWGSMYLVAFSTVGSSSQDSSPMYPVVFFDGSSWNMWLGQGVSSSDRLANPNQLQLTLNGVLYPYDGTKLVRLPAIDTKSLDVTGATVGQIPVITAVDSNGKPTAWGSADMPGGTDLNAVNVFVADFAHDTMTVTSGAVDKYSRVVVS